MEQVTKKRSQSREKKHDFHIAATITAISKEKYESHSPLMNCSNNDQSDRFKFCRKKSCVIWFRREVFTFSVTVAISVTMRKGMFLLGKEKKNFI